MQSRKNRGREMRDKKRTKGNDERWEENRRKG